MLKDLKEVLEIAFENTEVKCVVSELRHNSLQDLYRVLG